VVVVKEEAEPTVVTAQDGTVRGGSACSVAKRRSTSALAVLQLLSLLLWSCSVSQCAWARIRCGLLAKACRRMWRRRRVASHEGPSNARSALQIVWGLGGTLTWVRDRAGSGAPAAPRRARRRLGQ